MLLATSSFLQVIFAVLILGPIMLLWVVALVDLIGSHRSGLAIAGMLVLIVVLPILGPILYFVFRKPQVHSDDAEAAYLAHESQRLEAARRPVGGTGMYPR
jgi:ABC-type transport system involved in cytochrome c biogenesis permease component